MFILSRASQSPCSSVLCCTREIAHWLDNERFIDGDQTFIWTKVCFLLFPSFFSFSSLIFTMVSLTYVFFVISLYLTLSQMDIYSLLYSIVFVMVVVCLHTRYFVVHVTAAQHLSLLVACLVDSTKCYQGNVGSVIHEICKMFRRKYMKCYQEITGSVIKEIHKVLSKQMHKVFSRKYTKYFQGNTQSVLKKIRKVFSSKYTNWLQEKTLHGNTKCSQGNTQSVIKEIHKVLSRKNASRKYTKCYQGNDRKCCQENAQIVIKEIHQVFFRAFQAIPCKLL